MDIYRILEKLDAVSGKNTLTEGQMKRSLEDRAEKMSKADFVSNAGEYGMSAKEAEEFWINVNGGDEELDEERRSEEDWDAQALAQQKAKLAREKNRMIMQRKMQQQEKTNEGSPPGGFKPGDRVVVQGQKGPTGSTTGVFVQQIPTQAGQKPLYAFRFDDKKYPGNTYDQVSGNNIFPADGVAEGDMEEGNLFTGNLAKARAAGKTHADLDGDGDLEKVDEVFPGTPEYELRFGKDDAASAFDKKKISTGTVYSRRYRDEPESDDDAPKKAGRPTGTGKKLGAKGPSVNSKLLKDKGGLKEEDMEEARNPDLQKLRQHHLAAVLGDRAEKARARAKEKGYDTRSTRAALDATDAFGVAASGKDPSKYGFNVSKEKQDIGMKEHSHDIDIRDQGEYDREGDMAINQVHQIADAARELHAILAADDNLPEWVQSKITKALDYIDTARDYLDAEGEMDREESIPEASYSAKAARAGKDIGKPGKAFAKIAKDAGERYGSKERGEKVAGAVLAKLRAKEGAESVEEKAPPGAKAERMVKHIKAGYAKDGKLTDREKAIAYATAWKAKNAGKVEEMDYGNDDEKSPAKGHGHSGVKGKPGKEVTVGKDAIADKKRMSKDASDALDKASDKKEVDTGEADARKTTPSSKKDQEKVFAKHKERVKQLDKESSEKKDVEETTVAGSVATAPAEAPKKGKGGMQFGKGVYEGQVAESFETKLKNVLNEGMSVNVSTDDTGKKSISVNATDTDAEALGDLLKMAGLFSSEGYSRTCEHCHGIHEAGACQADMVEEGDLANSPDEVYADKDYMLQQLSGGLNGPKTTGQTTGPVVNRQDSRQGVMAEAERVKEQAESRLWNLYKKI